MFHSVERIFRLRKHEWIKYTISVSIPESQSSSRPRSNYRPVFQFREQTVSPSKKTGRTAAGSGSRRGRMYSIYAYWRLANQRKPNRHAAVFDLPDRAECPTYSYGSPSPFRILGRRRPGRPVLAFPYGDPDEPLNRLRALLRHSPVVTACYQPGSSNARHMWLSVIRM